MRRAKATIVIGIVMIIAVSTWMGFASNPISGIAFFFILTCLLWVIAKTRHWI